METYNDDWCQCPICFEIYSLEHRPTTFICGHSICIDHVGNNKGLKECPVCRQLLKPTNEYHVSFSLEEAVRGFNALKNSIYWESLVKKKEKIETNVVKSITNNRVDDSYERELRSKELLLDQIYPSKDRRSTRTKLFDF